MSLFNGLFTGLSAFPITPADESGRIDQKGLEIAARAARCGKSRFDRPARQHRDLCLSSP